MLLCTVVSFDNKSSGEIGVGHVRRGIRHAVADSSRKDAYMQDRCDSVKDKSIASVTPKVRGYLTFGLLPPKGVTGTPS